MNKYLKGLFVAILFLGLTSCDDALDEVPDNRTQIDSPEKIAELLTGAYVEAGYAEFLEPRTDNAIDKGPSAVEYQINTEAYFWRDVFIDDSDSPTFYWNACYKAIAQANQALTSIAELGDTPELQPLKAEALLCRAYAHFMLVNIWAKPYDPTTASSDLGIPYVNEPETVLIKQYNRGTVEMVYENIENDILEALPIVTNEYEVPTFHFNRSAANNFASRFFQYKADWDKVIQYSTAGLTENGAIRLRDWSGVYSTFNFNQLRARYTAISDIEPTNNLLVTAPSVFARRDRNSRYQIAPPLTGELFSQNNPTGEDWSYPIYSSGNDLTQFIPKYLEYFRFTNQSAGIGFPFATYVLLSNDEAILNRAEAYTMKGQFDLAMNDINFYLSFKTDDYDPTVNTLTADEFREFYAVDEDDRYTPFYTLSADALPIVNGLQELRRREFYNEGLRWFDIRRFDLEVLHKDVDDNEFLLEKGDNRRSLQIPNEAVSFGIEANPR